MHNMSDTKGLPKKLNIHLDDDQKISHKNFYEHSFTFIEGYQGTGKTYTACNIALRSLLQKDYNCVHITRKIPSKTNMGYMPGDLNEKMASWVRPIKENLYKCWQNNGFEEIQKLEDKRRIQIEALDFMQGITFDNSVIIVDEYSTMTFYELVLVMTRLGKNSKMVLVGDPEQSGISDSCCRDPRFKRLVKDGVVGYNKLTNNHRNPALEKILPYFRDDYEIKGTRQTTEKSITSEGKEEL